MYNLAEKLSISNIFNLGFGVFLGFFLMVVISIVIISLYVKKNNKNEEIRQISKRTYTNFYLKENNMKDKITSSLIYEVKEVSKLVYPDKKHPLFELSINEILNGINLVQHKLNRIVKHPLFKEIKNVHISSLLNLETIAKPALLVSKNKFFKLGKTIFNIFKTILNLFNPLFYIKKLLNVVLSKKGKKEIGIITLDFIGNTIYDIYKGENNLQK